MKQVGDNTTNFTLTSKDMGNKLLALSVDYLAYDDEKWNEDERKDNSGKVWRVNHIILI